MPTPADWLQFGALGLLGLVCSGGLAIALMVARALVRALDQMSRRMDQLSESVLLLKDPSVRSYLDELRRDSMRLRTRSEAPDTPREPRGGGRRT